MSCPYGWPLRFSDVAEEVSGQTLMSFYEARSRQIQTGKFADADSNSKRILQRCLTVLSIHSKRDQSVYYDQVVTISNAHSRDGAVWTCSTASLHMYPVSHTCGVQSKASGKRRIHIIHTCLRRPNFDLTERAAIATWSHSVLRHRFKL